MFVERRTRQSMDFRNVTVCLVCGFLALIPVVICFMSNASVYVSTENYTSPLFHKDTSATPRHFPHEIYTRDGNVTGAPLQRNLQHENFTDIGNVTGSPLARDFYDHHMNMTNEYSNTTGSPLARDFHDHHMNMTKESCNSTGYPLARDLYDHHMNVTKESSNTTGSPLQRDLHDLGIEISTESQNATGFPLQEEIHNFDNEIPEDDKYFDGFQKSRAGISPNSSEGNFRNGSSIMARQGYQVWRNCPGCGLLQRNRIVGGRKAAISEFPWTVSLRKEGVQHCGASIINKNYILTAAHCVKGHNIRKLEAVAAVTDIMDQRAFKTSIAGARIHENFEPTIYDYDVAVLQVTDPFPLNTGVKAVCLLEPGEDPTGQSAIVSGWGALRETDTEAPDYLSKLEVPVVDNERCAQAPGMRNQVITPRMLCAGFLDGSKDACIGDSGGPLVWNVKGQWKQIGIVSWGIGCARPGFYGIYSRVSMLLPWIASNTQDGQC